MKKIIFYLFVLVSSVFALENNVTVKTAGIIGDTKASKDREMTNDEISLFFIGFEEQARNELNAEEQKKQKKASLAKAVKKSPSFNGSERAVMPHDGPGVSVEGNRENIPMPSHVQDVDIGIPPMKSINSGLKLYGIICDGHNCQAFSNIGILKMHTKISNSEKVIEIKKSILRTNKRTIKL